MSLVGADRNLLLGLLGLQNGFVSREDLIAAVSIWLEDKSRGLGEILLKRGALPPDEYELLCVLVRKHLDKHGGNAEASLAALAKFPLAEVELRRLGDPELEATLVSLRPPGPAPEDPERTLDLGERTSNGQRFCVLRPHAQGGLGEVFVARDSELNREVALKRIQPQFADNTESRARFLLEAEITGGLEHPGIVPVYGLGRYEDGRPFYAMRFIRGDSLKEAADRFHGQSQARAAFDSADFRKLLGRFVDVCNAIEYAHSRGVLHRDLKPGNIMLGKYGETLVVDWGLAKAKGRAERTGHDGEISLRPSSGSGSSHTQAGEIVGTPAYMSPEQAAGRLDQLGTATDVYSLGATLYYVLTGQPPFDKDGKVDLLRKVERGEFAPPRNVRPELPKPLEAICLRAMAHGPDARYASPAALADDIEHYLADEPLTALADSLGDRMNRFARRNRTLVRLAAAALLAIATISTAAALLVNEQRRQNANLAIKNGELAEENGQIAEQKGTLLAKNTKLLESESAAKTAADDKRREAERARDETTQILNYFVDAFRKPDPESAGEKLTVAEILDQATQNLETQFPDQPVTQATVLIAIGRTYLGLGLYSQAVSNLERGRSLLESKLEATSDEVLLANHNLALGYWQAGRSDEAKALANKTLAALKAKYGDLDERALSTINTLAVAMIEIGESSEGLRLLEETVERLKTQLGADDPLTLTVMNNLAAGHFKAERLEEAVELHEQVVELMRSKLGVEDPDFIVALRNLALAYETTGRHELALEHSEKSVHLAKVRFGLTHPYTLAAMDVLAKAYASTGRVDEALALQQQVVEGTKERLGPDHHSTLTSMNNLAVGYSQAGKKREAIELHEEVLKRQKSVGPASGSSHLATMRNLAVEYQDVGRLTDAEAMLQETLRESKSLLGWEHPATLRTVNKLAGLYAHMEKHELALALCSEHREFLRESLSENHAATLEAMQLLAEARRRAKQYDEALALLADVVERRKQTLGTENRATLESMQSLAVALREAQRFADSIRVYEELVPLQGKTKGQGDQWTQNSMQWLAHLYRKSSQPDKALAWDEQRLTALCDTRKTRHGERHRLTIEAQGDLGVCLIEMKRFEEAERLLLESYRNLDDAKVVPGDCDRLIRLYSAWEKPAEAERWRQIRNGFDRTNNLAYHSSVLDYPLAMEAEKLKVVKVSGGRTWEQNMNVFSAGRWSAGAQILWCDGMKEGDRIDLEFPVTSSGPVDLAIVLTKARDYAIVRLYLDDKVVGEPIDLYHAPEVVPTEVLHLGNHDLKAGNHRLSIEIAGANAAAEKRYHVGVDCLLLGAAAQPGAKLMERPFPRASASHTSPVDKVEMVHDGTVQFGPTPHNRWTSYLSASPKDWLQIEFEVETEFSRVELAIYDESPGSGFQDPKGGGVRTPENYTIEYLDGETWKPVVEKSRTPAKPAGGQWNQVKFESVKAKKVRVVFTHQGPYRSGVTEMAVWP